ncbi:hypothetical protein PT111_08975, partial [Erysipelothrix rhusiopathiae]|nr:hypothetical protein [Erysipelothrix rhusiopathiae]
LSQQLEKCHVDESRLRIPYELDTTESIKTSTVRGFGLAFLPYLDCTLFERTHKGVALTDEGEVVLKYATRLISCHDKMIKEVE